MSLGKNQGFGIAAFLLETIGENCFFAFPSCLHSLTCGYITPTSTSVITSPSLILAFLSPFSKDLCDYIEPSHTIQDSLAASRSLTAHMHALPHALLPSQWHLCAYVRAWILESRTQTLISCDLGQVSFPFWISVSLTISRGAEGKRKQARQAEGKPSLW